MNLRIHLLRIFVSIFVLIYGTFVLRTPAEANYFNDFYRGVEQFSGLPSEVNQLKEGYKETLDDLDQARANAKAYEQQNKQLMEQNQQLAEKVQKLQQTNQSREDKVNKLKVTLIAVILLVAGYFVFIRILRFIMRRSNRG